MCKHCCKTYEAIGISCLDKSPYISSWCRYCIFQSPIATSLPSTAMWVADKLTAESIKAEMDKAKEDYKKMMDSQIAKYMNQIPGPSRMSYQAPRMQQMPRSTMSAESEYSATEIPEFYAATIYGYRVFTVRDKKIPDLTGVFMKDVYYPQVNSAGEYYESICHKNLMHEYPEASCKCGYWAVWDPRNLINASSGFSGIAQKGRMVIGVVEAKGQMLVGTKGFRAKEIRLVGLTNDHRFYNEMFLANGPLKVAKPNSWGSMMGLTGTPDYDPGYDIFKEIPFKNFTPKYTYEKLLDAYGVPDFSGNELYDRFYPLNPETLKPAEPPPTGPEQGAEGKYQYMTDPWPHPNPKKY